MEELKLIPPLQIPPESFPESEELPEGREDGKMERYLWL